MKHLVAEKVQCREESSVVLTVLKVHKTLLSTHKHHRGRWNSSPKFISNNKTTINKL